jgi:hypothetical protein
MPLRSAQATTKPPLVRPATAENSCWFWVVVVLTRNSEPTLVPIALNICALTEVLLSPPRPLSSVHVTTKPPLVRPVIVGSRWSLRVVVLTGNSAPTCCSKALIKRSDAILSDVEPAAMAFFRGSVF